MEEKRFIVNLVDGDNNDYYLQLTQSQINLLNYLIKNEVEIFNAEITVLGDITDYVVI